MPMSGQGASRQKYASSEVTWVAIDQERASHTCDIHVSLLSPYQICILHTFP